MKSIARERIVMEHGLIDVIVMDDIFCLFPRLKIGKFLAFLSQVKAVLQARALNDSPQKRKKVQVESPARVSKQFHVDFVSITGP